MLEVLAVLVFVAVAAFLLRRRARSGAQVFKPSAPTALKPSEGPAQTPTRPLDRPQAPRPPASDRDGMPFAKSGMRGPLFTYAGLARSTKAYPRSYAVIDLETTGLSPRAGDRVIEVAVARVSTDGRVEDEFASLVNPEGRDSGPVFIHGITNEVVAEAPTFRELLPELLARLDGAVVVAHNASFEEAFLYHEFARVGVRGIRMPALCTLWLSRRTFETPNHKLATLARSAGIPLVDKHSALGDVRAVAQLLPLMLDRHGNRLSYACAPYAHVAAGRRPCPPLVTRAVALRKGNDGWMSSLVNRLPMSANDADNAVSQAYLDALAEVLEDGRIIGREAKMLARLAGQAGLGGQQVRALNERFLEMMRQAAFADEILTATELRELSAAARALGVPAYFDDLQPTTSARNGGSDALAGAAAATDGRAGRRCGHCRQPGHYRSTCPELRAS